MAKKRRKKKPANRQGLKRGAVKRRTLKKQAEYEPLELDGGEWTVLIDGKSCGKRWSGINARAAAERYAERRKRADRKR